MRSGKGLMMRLETPSCKDAADIAGNFSRAMGPRFRRLLELCGHFLCKVFLFLLDSLTELVTDKPVKRNIIAGFL